MRIRIDPRRAAQLGVQLDAVRSQIAAYTVNAPKGTLHGPSQSATIYANDQVFDAAVWNQMIIGYHNGAPVSHPRRQRRELREVAPAQRSSTAARRSR